jgi:hypothetical protein
LISCSSVALLEAVHKAQLEGQQTIVVRFEALDKELVLVPVKVKTGTHRGARMLVMHRLQTLGYCCVLVLCYLHGVSVGLVAWRGVIPCT